MAVFTRALVNSNVMFRQQVSPKVNTNCYFLSDFFLLKILQNDLVKNGNALVGLPFIIA